MNDLIYRQAAIDALNKLDVSDGVGISSIACDLQEKAIRSIEILPSAGQEIIRCKDCKCKDKYENFCWMLLREIDPSDYCSYAERKE